MISENITRKIDALGRITLPKGLRDRLGIAVGDELEILTEGNVICLRPADKTNIEADIKALIDKWCGCDISEDKLAEIAEKLTAIAN